MSGAQIQRELFAPPAAWAGRCRACGGESRRGVCLECAEALPLEEVLRVLGYRHQAHGGYPMHARQVIRTAANPEDEVVVFCGDCFSCWDWLRSTEQVEEAR